MFQIFNQQGRKFFGIFQHASAIWIILFDVKIKLGFAKSVFF